MPTAWPAKTVLQYSCFEATQNGSSLINYFPNRVSHSLTFAMV